MEMIPGQGEVKEQDAGGQFEGQRGPWSGGGGTPGAQGASCVHYPRHPTGGTAHCFHVLSFRGLGLVLVGLGWGSILSVVLTVKIKTGVRFTQTTPLYRTANGSFNPLPP